MLFSAGKLNIPKRMVQHEQYSGQVVEHREQIHQSAVLETGRILREFAHDFCGQLGRKIVDAYMEEPDAEWHRPFHRDRNVSECVEPLQELAGFNTVMVGDRHQRLKSNLTLNLFLFPFNYATRGDRRRPVGAGKVDLLATLDLTL